MLPREPLPTRVDALPRLPEAYHERVDRGVAQLGLRLDDRQLAALDVHVRLLLAWNAAINLTAISDPARIATQHVIDSLAAVHVLRARRVERLLDLGSGGGFPGLPLAVAIPVRSALLVESVGKKAAFLSAAAGVVMAAATDLRVEVAAERAEALGHEPDHRGHWPAVTARAIASLGELVELAFPLLEPGGCLVAWKRGDIAAEMAAGHRAVTALGGGTLESVAVDVPGLDEHRLVIATREGAVADRYPRDPRIRKDEPW